MRALTLAFLFLSISFSVSAQNYPIEVEAYQVHTTTEGLAELDGMTTYRFYITNLGPNDFITSIYGNDQVHFELSVPGGIYNSSYNSSWSASGISQVFVDLFPELEYDSYATIGLTQSASTSGIAGAADPSLIEDPTQRLSSMFLTDGSVGGTINSVSGFTYYILNNSNNTAGLPDVDGRVLIMQITTSGALSGTLNALIFPESVGSDYVMATYMFDGAGLYAASGDCVADTDGDGICDIYDNCTGSYDECGICDGDGIQEGECDCNGNQFDECGVCGGTGIPAGDCDCDGNQLDAINVCGGDCQSDDNNNGICDINDCNPESFCGPGTYWNEDTETCLISIITDTNLDGCTDLNDLMDILAAYGDCAVSSCPVCEGAISWKANGQQFMGDASATATMNGTSIAIAGVSVTTAQIGFVMAEPAIGWENGVVIPMNLATAPGTAGAYESVGGAVTYSTYNGGNITMELTYVVSGAGGYVTGSFSGAMQSSAGAGVTISQGTFAIPIN